MEGVQRFQSNCIVIIMQQGYTKYACFLYERDSRDGNSHYIRKKWPERNWKVGEKNVQRQSLVAREDILLPSLHI